MSVIGTGCRRGTPEAAPGRESARRPQRVEVVELERHRLVETLEVTGTLAANESVQIRPEIAGVVLRIGFEEGQQVEQGALLVQLDDAEIRAQIAQAEARAELARVNLQRAENLAASRSIPASDLDQARTEATASQAELALLRVRLDRTVIRAPMSGVVGGRAFSPGDYITPSMFVTTLDDLSRMKISFRVPERFLHKVEVGTPVLARVRAGSQADQRVEAAGEVYFVSASLDPAVRAAEVKAVLSDPPRSLKPGMFASAVITLEVREDALAVPEGALLSDARGVQIITVDEADGQPVAKYVRVNTGLRTRGLVEVSAAEGEQLEAGVRVVASGVGALILFPGAPLDPIPLREAFRIGGGSDQ